MSLLQALRGDHAQAFLVGHLARTQERLNRAVVELAGGGQFWIASAADLGLPADVQRLAGGFTTGCVVRWESAQPVYPVDTSVAIDLSTVIVLDRPLDPIPGADFFDRARQRVDAETSYTWNFQLGNHFLILGERSSDGAPVLVIHSSECEFDYQLNGILPHPQAWYWSDVREFHDADGSYVRLLVGDRATTLARLNSSLVSYSELRHELVAEILLAGSARITEVLHKPHFYMPTPQSLALGCYLCEPNERVPVFSSHGTDIAIFECRSGGDNVVEIADGVERLVVPHGWGRTTSRPIHLSLGDGDMEFNDVTYPIAPRASIAGHPDVALREFGSGADASSELFAAISRHTPGQVVDTIAQRCSYSAAGYARHR